MPILESTTMTNLQLARHLAAEGFCVLPLVADGKRPARPWKRLQTTKPSEAELWVWFHENDFTPGIVTGAISGITVIDCDNDAAYVECRESGIDSPLTQTTKRGRHLVFRHNGERNTVRVHGIAKCDRRGEGGYIRAYTDAARWCRGDVLDAGYAPTEHEALPEARSQTPGGWTCQSVEGCELATFDAEELSWDAATQSWVEPEAVGA